MIIKVLYEYSVLGDDEYDYIEAFECDYHPKVSVDMAREWMKSKFSKWLLNKGVIVNRIKELC